MTPAAIPGRLALLVGGGPAPGINGVISSVAIEAVEQGIEVIGFLDGFRWLAAGDADHYRKLTIDDVKAIQLRGGSILGTSRIGHLRIAVACSALLTSVLALADDDLDARVQAALRRAGLTGTIQAQLVPRLGRPLNPALADLGRLLWFDKLDGLHDDNTCGGCHSPSRAFGDTQSIAIGIQNNNLVGCLLYTSDAADE